MRRSQPGKRGHDVYAFIRFDLISKVFRVFRILYKPQFVPYPLNDGSRYKNAAFYRIVYFIAYGCRNRCQKAMIAFAKFFTGVHQQKTSCAVSVFGLASFKACLAEERGLLVTGTARYRDSGAADFHITVYPAAAYNFRQHILRNVEHGTYLRIPAEVFYVIQHGTARVSMIGDMNLAVGQFPYQPTVHGAEKQLALFGHFPCTLNIVKNPFQLCS